MHKTYPIELRINDLQKILPHRYPFLLVDKVRVLKPGEEGVGYKNITMNEPQFTGHFPENPIMPGVLILEALAQTCGIIACENYDKKMNQVLFMGIDNVKFRKPFIPGDVMEMHVVKQISKKNVYRFKTEAFCGDQIYTEAILTAMIVK